MTIVLFRSIRILAVPIALSLLAGPHGARADLLDPITNLLRRRKIQRPRSRRSLPPRISIIRASFF